MAGFLHKVILSTALTLAGGIYIINLSPAIARDPSLQQFVAQVSVVDAIRSLDGKAYIRAADGQGLGIVSSDQYAAESICNKYGNFGSPYSGTSVLNRYAEYGSPYSNISAFNPRAQKPPVVIFEGGAIFLSKNPKLANRIDPEIFFGVLCR
ncbi:hypothetical protein ACE1B6_25550 [Aerosakkonemataceae cyanobacterium BLCC-F154]|uniref:Uncharacterized protein n=1 Tax=Floridaenema fluviatile BLCC-F154 TaxID=3153640 RepID=A0ABV4YIH4_9CYAN